MMYKCIIVPNVTEPLVSWEERQLRQIMALCGEAYDGKVPC